MQKRLFTKKLFNLICILSNLNKISDSIKFNAALKKTIDS